MSFILLGILNSQAAAGGGGIDPATLNPDLWLDASDASTITESGGSVSQWNNKGTLENFTQATSADQPTTGATTINGLNVIDFAFDFLSGSTASQWKFMHDGTKYFFAIVIRLDVATSGDANYIFGTTNRSSEIGHTFYSQGTDPWGFIMQPSVISIADADFLPYGNVNIASALLQPTLTASERIDYFTNETQGTETNSNSSTPSGSNPTNNMNIGGTRNGVIRIEGGSIGEMVVVSGADATEENRAGVVQYLNNKWGAF